MELTADIYQISRGMVSRWLRQRNTIKIQAEIQKQCGERQIQRSRKPQFLRSRVARYVYTENSLCEELKKRRLSGRRVSGRWIRVRARHILKFVYGGTVAAGFRASHGRLTPFMDRNRLV